MKIVFSSWTRIALLMLGVAALGGCSNEEVISIDTASTETFTTEQDLESEGVESWVAPEGQGPWNGALVVADSDDGLTFEGGTVLVENAGVPNLLKRDKGELVLIYQYFSLEQKSEFDVIAYSVSEDDGKTWSEMALVEFEGLPEAIDANKKPMDPTLVETEEGGLRLYFTYHVKGAQWPALYSAYAEGGTMEEPFVVETTPALETGFSLLDPAVVYFEGSWHHYTWKDQSDENVHSISEDGVTFVQQDDISLPMDFLGQVIRFEDGLRFYGTGKGEVVSAYSDDGETWVMENSPALQRGADPAVQALGDGSYLMVYTSMNFNE